MPLRRAGLAIRLSLFLMAALGGVIPCAFPQNQDSVQLPIVPMTPGSAPMDLEAYRAELSQISSSVSSGGDLREIRLALPTSWSVQVKDRVFEVSTREIAEALSNAEHNPDRAKALKEKLLARLGRMGKEAGDLETKSLNSTQEAGEKLDTILKRGEFQEAKGPSPVDLFWARVNRWILEHLVSLLDKIHISHKTGNFLSWAVIILAVVLLFYLVYKWLSKGAKEEGFKAPAEPQASDPRHWIDEALAAAERADYREAIHCAYWASIARLEDIRILPRDRARTPRESLRLMEQHPREQGVLQSVTRSFELIWYGYRPADKTDWLAAKDQLEKMGWLQASTAQTASS